MTPASSTAHASTPARRSATLIHPPGARSPPPDDLQTERHSRTQSRKRTPFGGKRIRLSTTGCNYFWATIFAVNDQLGFKFLNAAALALLVIVVQTACTNKGLDLAQNSHRNVLLITVDTLRGDALGCDGGPARTPNIDALAAGGIRFSFAHAQAVVTLPSHASILTGLYPFQHGYRENSGYRLTPGVQTLANRLKANGFSTGAFVAAFPLDARFGLTPGFDVYDGRFDDVGTGAEFLLPERPAPAVVSRAVQWIGQRDGRWFAWVHLYDPHAPYRPPPPFDREYAAQPYYGEVAAADQALAPLLAAARGGSRSTLVVLTGDHGESLGEHGELTHGLFAYESTLRVPLILTEISGTQSSQRPQKDNGFFAGGGIADQPVRHVDI